MTGVEWNKKEELLQDQALRHLKQYLPLFAAFTNNFKSEINLLNKIQEYCYDNMNFLKTFNKIILLLYKSKQNPSEFLKSLTLLHFHLVFSRHIERRRDSEMVQGVSFSARMVCLHGTNEKVHRVA